MSAPLYMCKGNSKAKGNILKQSVILEDMNSKDTVLGLMLVVPKTELTLIWIDII